MLSGIYGRRITQNNNIKVLPRSDYAKYVGLSKSTLIKKITWIPLFHISGQTAHLTNHQEKYWIEYCWLSDSPRRVNLTVNLLLLTLL